MKKAFRHTAAPEKPARHVHAKNGLKAPRKHSATKGQEKPGKLTAPIFNTRFAGMPYTYIRPFDPVWMVDLSV